MTSDINSLSNYRLTRPGGVRHETTRRWPFWVGWGWEKAVGVCNGHGAERGFLPPLSPEKVWLCLPSAGLSRGRSGHGISSGLGEDTRAAVLQSEGKLNAIRGRCLCTGTSGPPSLSRAPLGSSALPAPLGRPPCRSKAVRGPWSLLGNPPLVTQRVPCFLMQLFAMTWGHAGMRVQPFRSAKDEPCRARVRAAPCLHATALPPARGLVLAALLPGSSREQSSVVSGCCE